MVSRRARSNIKERSPRGSSVSFIDSDLQNFKRSKNPATCMAISSLRTPIFVELSDDGRTLVRVVVLLHKQFLLSLLICEVEGFGGCGFAVLDNDPDANTRIFRFLRIFSILYRLQTYEIIDLRNTAN